MSNASTAQAVTLIRDHEGVIVDAKIIEPMPAQVIQKNYGPWQSLEQIVRWVEVYHNITGEAK